MSKRNTTRAYIVLASALATLCLFAAIITAQKTPNTVMGAPLKGIDVKLGSNPGGNAAARTTDENGQAKWDPLPPGSYYLEIVLPPKGQITANRGAVPDLAADDYLVVEITGGGVVGGKKVIAWEVKNQKFVAPKSSAAGAKATAAPPVYTTRFLFDIGGGPPEPLNATIIKSKSNISNN